MKPPIVFCPFEDLVVPAFKTLETTARPQIPFVALGFCLERHIAPSFSVQLTHGTRIHLTVAYGDVPAAFLHDLSLVVPLDFGGPLVPGGAWVCARVTNNTPEPRPFRAALWGVSEMHPPDIRELAEVARRMYQGEDTEPPSC